MGSPSQVREKRAGPHGLVFLQLLRFQPGFGGSMSLRRPSRSDLIFPLTVRRYTCALLSDRYRAAASVLYSRFFYRS
jgi:hypothetical protein